MPYSLSLEITDFLPSSLNKSLRAHYHKRAAQNAAWDALIFAEVANKKPPAPLPRAWIRLVRHSHRMLDFDGLVGSMKPVVDALVTCRVLADDSWNVLGAWSVDQKFRPKASGQLLEIFVSASPIALS